MTSYLQATASGLVSLAFMESEMFWLTDEFIEVWGLEHCLRKAIEELHAEIAILEERLALVESNLQPKVFFPSKEEA